MTSRPSGPHRGHVPSPDASGTASSVDRGDPSGPNPSRPLLLRVVTGEPTPEELAALTVVVAALSQHRPRGRRPTPVGAWADSADRHRRALRPGPGGWRAAGRWA